MNKKRICTTCNSPLIVRPELLIKPASGGTFVLCPNVRCYDLCPAQDGGGGNPSAQKAELVHP